MHSSSNYKPNVTVIYVVKENFIPEKVKKFKKT